MSVQSVVYNLSREQWVITLSAPAVATDHFTVSVTHTAGQVLAPYFTGAYYNAVSSEIVFTSLGSNYIGTTSFIATLAPASSTLPGELSSAARLTTPISGTITLTVGGVSGSYSYDYATDEAIGTEAAPDPAQQADTGNVEPFDYSNHLSRIVIALERLTFVNENISNSLAKIAAEASKISISQAEISNNTGMIRKAAVSDGTIERIYLLDAGSGYGSATVTIDKPEFGTDTATATFSGGTITLTHAGSGYNSSPGVKISPPANISSYVEFSPGLKVSTNDYVRYQRNYYKVHSSRGSHIGNLGTLGAEPPTTTSGTITSGQVDLEFVGSQAAAVAVLSGGFGIHTADPYNWFNMVSGYEYFVSKGNILDPGELPTYSTDAERVAEKITASINKIKNLPSIL